MKRLLLLTLFLVLVSPSIQAKINNFTNKNIHLNTGITIPGYSIQFKNIDEDTNLNISPNIKSQISLGASFSDLFGLGWGVATDQSDKTILDKGKTDYLDFRFNFAFKKFLISTNYSDFKGLFIEEGAAPFTLYPNMNLRNMSINIVYVTRPSNFSMAAMYDQTKRQEKSGGSWLVASSLEESYFNNHGQTFLTGQMQNFGSDQNITSARFRTLNLYAGGGYTIAYRKAYYISGTVLYGIGLQQSRVILTDRSYEDWDKATKFTVNLATGYNGLRFFSGVGFFATGTANTTESIEVSNNMYTAKLTVGVHL